MCFPHLCFKQILCWPRVCGNRAATFKQCSFEAFQVMIHDHLRSQVNAVNCGDSDDTEVEYAELRVWIIVIVTGHNCHE